MDLHILPLLVLVGAGSGLASGLFGVGGGIVIVPALTLLVGLGPRDAVAASLLVFVLTAPLGIWRHWKGGNVRLRTGLILGGAGVAGVLIGQWLERYLTDRLFFLLFALVIVLASHQLAYGQPPKKAMDGLGPMVATGVAAGVVAKLFGIGGGIVMVPAMVFSGLGIHEAVGTSLVAVFVNGTVASVLNLLQSRSWVPYALGVSLGAFVGIQLGARQAIRTSAAGLRRAFALLLVLVALEMTRQSFLA